MLRDDQGLARACRAWLYRIATNRAPTGGIRHGTGLLVLTLTGDRICAVTRFDNSVLPWFGLPRSLPDWYFTPMPGFTTTLLLPAPLPID